MENITENYSPFKETCKPLDNWLPLSRMADSRFISPFVKDLLMWRNRLLTGFVFGCLMTLLLSLRYHSLISVLCIFGIVGHFITLGYRCLNCLTYRINEPFGHLDLLLQLNVETADCLAYYGARAINGFSTFLRALIYGKNWTESLKRMLLFCVLSLFGDLVDALTLIILATIMLFTMPKLYMCYKPTFDILLDKLNLQLDVLFNYLNIKPCIKSEPPVTAVAYDYDFLGPNSNVQTVEYDNFASDNYNDSSSDTDVSYASTEGNDDFEADDYETAHAAPTEYTYCQTIYQDQP